MLVRSHTEQLSFLLYYYNTCHTFGRHYNIYSKHRPRYVSFSALFFCDGSLSFHVRRVSLYEEAAHLLRRPGNHHSVIYCNGHVCYL